jgi:hypothetical protein
MGVMNQKHPTAIEGTMNHAKTSFSTEMHRDMLLVQ